ncbi:hypothetical protein N9850_11020 [Granulosicoccus sp.]|nr:hypothetical protein [Granulosicoccus sp.]MDB4224295.1 hypothetical protein [Granulosicoccus sp.]
MMDIFSKNHRFQFGEKNILGIVDRIVDPAKGLYDCVYLQHGGKVVKDRFKFDGEHWHFPEEPCGIVLKYAEEARYRSLLKAD